MTPREHYIEAERLLDAAIGKKNGGELVMLAQVHATLAATATSLLLDPPPDPRFTPENG